MVIRTIKLSSLLQLFQVTLLIAAVGLLIWSRPWNSTSETRKITVTGEGSVKESPDSYQFTPSYQETGTDPEALLAAMTNKANEVTTKLKELGVSEDDIALQSNTYDQYWYDTSTKSASFYLTIVVNDKELAQKVQDYLLTTLPEGSVSPYPTFSDEKSKSLKDTAREKAIADATEKANRVAEETGVKVGKVLSISEDVGGGIIPMSEISLASDTTQSLPILSGKQEISISVTISFAIK